jgi:hypothetical protein
MFKEKMMLKHALLIALMGLSLAGCATSSSYIHYTDQQYPPKDQYFNVNIYPASQVQSAVNPYYVIGKVSVEGFASSGVSPETLSSQAKVIARRRGADAIINARTEAIRYYYGDSLLRFVGELIVYATPASK